jgi:hypothetical protein
LQIRFKQIVSIKKNNKSVPAKRTKGKSGPAPHAIPIGDMLHWTASHRREDPKSNSNPPKLESALGAILSSQHLMPIVSKSEQPLKRFETNNELAELVLLPPKLRKCLTKAAERLKQSLT